MGLERIPFEDRETWLSGRMRGIGGSEAAAAIGRSPWMTPLELWKIKIGAKAPKDIGEKEYVQEGVRLEPALRGLFAARHPELSVEYHQFDVLYQTERPWLFATLDGELLHTASGRRGVLEIKKAAPVGKAGWAEWADGRMKESYYVQVLHQLLATGYDFVAALFSMSGDITIREYEIERADVADDLAWLLGEETKFWSCCERRVLPPMPLRL